MKLQNKKTGEIDDYIFEVITDRIDLYKRIGYSDTKNVWHYKSIAELTEDWEDAPEEPEEHYFISNCGEVKPEKGHSLHRDERIKIGNDFKSKEEAEKAVEKLKAWKRLKDKGFRFERWTIGGEYGNTITFSDYFESNDKTRADLDLLFGGEE